MTKTSQAPACLSRAGRTSKQQDKQLDFSMQVHLGQTRKTKYLSLNMISCIFLTIVYEFIKQEQAFLFLWSDWRLPEPELYVVAHALSSYQFPQYFDFLFKVPPFSPHIQFNSFWISILNKLSEEKKRKNCIQYFLLNLFLNPFLA